ncbi:MAG TPA: L-threonylcarbamoyladenylate synthase [Rhizomicrobium sp.]|nr:L-threonylcarbamoyladenylate synthase [Rhizomicrobium sp.]
MTIVVPANAHGITLAAGALREGKLVAFPTETVYGLGADATNGEAVAAIFAAKGRPAFNPLIVHVKDHAAAEALVEFTPEARKLADAFWPGALTLVLPRKDNSPLSLLVSAGLDTVAIRVPSHPVAQMLVAQTGPIAAPSANTSGRISPTTAAHVAEELGGKVEIILDGGSAQVGVESTVVGFEDGKPVMLRPGGISREDIERIAGPLAVVTAAKIQSPGQLESHYAPHAKLRLNARDTRPGESLLGFGTEASQASCNLSPSGDLNEAAANLFAMLRALDKKSNAIAVMPIPNEGLGEAINDRLKRAAAPRP